MNRSSLVSFLALWFAGASPSHAVDYPGPPPGTAQATCSATEATLENGAIAMRWTFADGRLKPSRLTHKQSSTSLSLADHECFCCQIADAPDPRPRTLHASKLKFAAPPAIKQLHPEPDAARLSERFGGWELSARLTSAASELDVLWRAVLRDGANYIRQEVSLCAAGESLELSELVLLELAGPAAETIGSVDGSPVVAGNVFAACEHPMSRNQVLPAAGDTRLVRCSYPYHVALQSGRPVAFSGVIGVVPEGQLRRGFLHYLERERSQPYRTFLHYNCGYEVGARFWQLRRYGTPEEFESFVGQQEQMWLDRIAVFGRELVENRGVVLDSFVHDHAWDDTELVWQFHKGFPQGLANVRQAAEKYRSAVGIWFSPWGGYSGRARRVEAGQRQGFETSKLGLSLAGPRYAMRFRHACLGMVRDYGVNYFKFDGFAAGNSLAGAGAYPGDVEALLGICDDLRRLKPGVFLNPTTGTWPSPFWLLWADAIWRQESDAGFLGQGSDRQQWLTYRDNATYHATVQRGPLCPISSLMLHGIMIHKMAFQNPYDPKSRGVSREPADVLAEIRSYFATGTCMQELHIDPALMTDAFWDVLAEAANWSRANADVLADTHWIGGDPAQGEVYGWASWAKRKGILSLRNPCDQPATIPIDIAKAFELPAGGAQSYSLRSPWKQDAAVLPLRLMAGRHHAFELKPFEVQTFDATPES